MALEPHVTQRVHSLFWDAGDNCAATTLTIGAELFRLSLDPQVLEAALGLWGAGGYRAQCGLVEGGLMLFGLLGSRAGIDRAGIGRCCRSYAEAFEREFGGLSCRELRPGGFRKDDPPHRCEDLARRTVLFTCRELANRLGLEPEVPDG